MTQERDCNTCRHHVQGGALEDQPPRCWVCGIRSTRSHEAHPLFAPFPTLREVPIQDAYAVTDKGLPEAGEVPAGPLGTQVGGTHYKGFVIQPIEFAMVNDLNACQAKVIKYVTRKKGDLEKRLEDLEKAKHVIDVWAALLKAGKVEA